MVPSIGVVSIGTVSRPPKMLAPLGSLVRLNVRYERAISTPRTMLTCNVSFAKGLMSARGGVTHPASVLHVGFSKYQASEAMGTVIEFWTPAPATGARAAPTISRRPRGVAAAIARRNRLMLGSTVPSVEAVIEGFVRRG